MVDVLPQVEIEDNAGTTSIVNGTATTTPTLFPTVAGNSIDGFGLKNTGNQTIEWSLDNTNYFPILKGEFFSWDLKGSGVQIWIRAQTGTSTFSLVLNREVD